MYVQDVTVAAGVLRHVRRYVQRGRQVYAPIVRWMGRGFTERFDRAAQRAAVLNVATAPGSEEAALFAALGQVSAGRWADSGTGLVAFALADAEQVGGWDEERFQDQHGWEDTDFLWRLYNAPLGFVRRKEEGLFHFAHARGTWECPR